MLLVLMLLLDAALPQRVGRPTHYTRRRHYAHRRLARLRLVQLMVPTRGGPGRASLRSGRRRHRGLARRLVAVRRRAILMMPKSQRPQEHEERVRSRQPGSPIRSAECWRSVDPDQCI